jgi:hypothetical protein
MHTCISTKLIPIDNISLEFIMNPVHHLSELIHFGRFWITVRQLSSHRLRATPTQCTVQQQILDEEKSKRVGLAQQNGFGPALLHRMLRLAKRHSKA